MKDLTQYEKEKKLKKLRAEYEEKIDAIGQESDSKAVPIVTDFYKEDLKKDQAQRDHDYTYLKDFGKNRAAYQRYLLVILNRYISEESIPSQYKIYAESTDDGIVVGIMGTEYMNAFRVSGLPFYDVNACKVLAIQTGNTVARMEGHLRTTDEGIILVNKEEFDLTVKHGRSN